MVKVVLLFALLCSCIAMNAIYVEGASGLFETVRDIMSGNFLPTASQNGLPPLPDLPSGWEEEFGIRLRLTYHEQKPMGYKRVHAEFVLDDENPGKFVVEHHYLHMNFDDKVIAGGQSREEYIDIPKEEMKKVLKQVRETYYYQSGGVEFTYAGGKGHENRLCPSCKSVPIDEIFAYGLFPVNKLPKFVTKIPDQVKLADHKLLNGIWKSVSGYVSTVGFAKKTNKALKELNIIGDMTKNAVDQVLGNAVIVGNSHVENFIEPYWRSLDERMKAWNREHPTEPVEDRAAWLKKIAEERMERPKIPVAYLFFQNPNDLRENDPQFVVGMIIWNDGTSDPLTYRMSYKHDKDHKTPNSVGGLHTSSYQPNYQPGTNADGKWPDFNKAKKRDDLKGYLQVVDSALDN